MSSEGDEHIVALAGMRGRRGRARECGGGLVEGLRDWLTERLKPLSLSGQAVAVKKPGSCDLRGSAQRCVLRWPALRLDTPFSRQQRLR